jgi:perosamine synthetase
VPDEAEWAFGTFWMYTILVDAKEAGLDSRSLLRELGAKKIQSRPLWQPIHRSPAHIVSDESSCPISEALHRDALSLPCSVGLTSDDQGRVIEAISSLVGRRVGSFN